MESVKVGLTTLWTFNNLINMKMPQNSLCGFFLTNQREMRLGLICEVFFYGIYLDKQILKKTPMENIFLAFFFIQCLLLKIKVTPFFLHLLPKFSEFHFNFIFPLFYILEPTDHTIHKTKNHKSLKLLN